MSDPNFDWSTEDHSDWDAPTEEVRPSGRRLRLPASIILLIVVALVGGVLMWQLRGQVEEASEQFEVEARASAELLFSAALKEDLELFSTVTSGLDMQWVGQQQQAIANSTLFDRSAFGMTWDGATPEITQVTLDKVLTTAEVTATLRYDVDGQTTTLQLPITLRKGNSRWLYAPPLEPFWGEESNQRASHLNVIYPTRDSVIMDRLVPDLNEIIRQSGAVEFGDIQPERQIFIEFSTNPDSINRPPERSTNESLVLATPSLIGMPLDEVGYQALLRYYAAHVYMPVLAARDLYDCCTAIVWFEAIVDWELARAGVQNWPLSAEKYKEIAFDTHPQRYLERLSAWNATDKALVDRDSQELAYAIVQTIGDSRPDLIPRDMLRALSDNNFFGSWVQSLLTPETQLPDNQLSAYLLGLDGSFHNNSELPPLPAEQIVLACESVDGGGSIYALDWDATQWGTWRVVETLAQPVRAVRTLPGHRGLWIEESETTASLWQQNERTPLPRNWRYFGNHSPDGETLVVLKTGIDGQLEEASGLVQVDNCSAENCPVEPRFGQVSWAPDGQHQLIRDFPNQRTYIVDKDGNQVKLINSGPQFTQALWLNNDTVAWLIDKATYVKATLTSENVLTWITVPELWPFLPDINSFNQPAIRASHAGAPDEPNHLILTISDDGTPKHILSHIPDKLLTTWIPGLDDNFYLGTSPLGGIIAAAGYEDGNSSGRLVDIALHTLKSNETTRYDYSSASKTHFLETSDDWLMIYDREQIRLIAPGVGLERQILPPASNCSSATWLNMNSQ